jgi:hypothetical protein
MFAALTKGPRPLLRIAIIDLADEEYRMPS